MTNALESMRNIRSGIFAGAQSLVSAKVEANVRDNVLHNLANNVDRNVRRNVMLNAWSNVNNNDSWNKDTYNITEFQINNALELL